VAKRSPIFSNPHWEEKFQRDGYVIVPFTDESSMANMRQKLTIMHGEFPDRFHSSSFLQNDTIRLGIESCLEEWISPLIANNHYPSTSLGASLLNKPPGPDSSMEWHQDWTIVDESQYDSLTYWIPLQEITNTNGALKVVPGSHRSCTQFRSPCLENPLKGIESELEKDGIFLFPKVGEAVIFSHALAHASAANHSSENRLVATFGLVPKEAELCFYYKSESDTELTPYSVSAQFFRDYNRIIGQVPNNAKANKPVSIPSPHSAFSYRLSQAQTMQNTSMKPLFQNPELQLQFEREGYVVIPTLEVDEINRLKLAYEEVATDNSNRAGFHVSMDELTESENRRIKDLLFETILPKLSQHLLDYQPYVASFVVKDPHPMGYVPAHQDWSFVDREEEGFTSITCWTALVDATPENGCLGVIKGSNQFFRNVRPSPSPQTPVPLSELQWDIFPYLNTIPMKAGETIMFDNRTFHASGPNITEGLRLAAGIGITQVDAELVHYFLKPNGRRDTVVKYRVDSDFYIKYNNARLSELYDLGLYPDGYDALEELPYECPQIDKQGMIALMEKAGNAYHPEVEIPFQESKQPPVEILNDSIDEIEPESSSPSFFQIYTPVNIWREVQHRMKSWRK
jgi:ectoine hydroxylase-related dioxygenase (phytanoyl-CoA dioxygenase family)